MNAYTNSLPSHDEIVHEIARLSINAGHQAWTEQRLPNNRIADVLAISAGNRIEIYEVKTHARPSDVDAAWLKYRPYAHRLWVISIVDTPDDKSLIGRPYSWPPQSHPAGVLLRHPVGYKLIRTARLHTIAPALVRDLLKLLSETRAPDEAASLSSTCQHPMPRT